MINPKLIPYLEKMDGWNSLVRWSKKNNAEKDLEHLGQKYIKKAQQQYEQDPKAFSDTSLRDTPSANVRWGTDVYGIGENKLKITKEQLKRIIKEELSSINEGSSRPFQQRIARDKLRKEEQGVSLEDVLAKAAQLNKAQGGLGLTAKEAIEAMHNEVDPPTQDQLNYLNDKFPGYNKDALARLYDETTGDFQELEEGKQKMKITKEQLRKIIKEELTDVMKESYGSFGSAMEHPLKQKVMSNINRDIQSGRIEDRYEKTTGNPLEVRKYVALLGVIENSNYDEEMLSDPEMAAGLWMDIFGTVEDQTYWDGYKKVDIRFSSPEIEAMCPDCGPIWDQVVRDNGMDGPGYGVDLQSDQRTMPEAKDERSDADFERGGNPTFDKKGLDDFMVRKYGPDKSKWPGGKK